MMKLKIGLIAVLTVLFLFSCYWSPDSGDEGSLTLTIDGSKEITATFLGDLSNSLVLYYAFHVNEGGTVTDLSGKGNTGTVNGATWTNDSISIGSYSFYGSNDGIHLLGDQQFWIVCVVGIICLAPRKRKG